jgi:hypothetical protein
VSRRAEQHVVEQRGVRPGLAVMSCNGSPGTPMMSASSPSASRPRSVTSKSSAAVTVAARSTTSGVIPRLTSATSSLAFLPCGMAGASVPTAMRTPAS